MAPSHRRAAGAAILLSAVVVTALAAAAMLASVPARGGEGRAILGEDTMMDKVNCPAPRCPSMHPSRTVGMWSDARGLFFGGVGFGVGRRGMVGNGGKGCSARETDMRGRLVSQALFASPMKQCCGMVPWPCCSHESCCDAYEEEGLDKEDEDEDKALSPQMLEQIPDYRRSGPRNLARGPRFAVEEVPRVYYQEPA
jgi:hypothetical protein